MSVCSTSRVFANRTSCVANSIKAANRNPPDTNANQGIRRPCCRVPKPRNVIELLNLLSVHCQLRSTHTQRRFHDLPVKRDQQGEIRWVDPTVIEQFDTERNRP